MEEKKTKAAAPKKATKKAADKKTTDKPKAKAPKKEKEAEVISVEIKEIISEVIVESTPPWEEEQPIIDEVVNQVIVEEIREEVIEAVEEPLVSEEPEVPQELSKEAENWEKWLAYQRMTPEVFLEKYPTHKFKHRIEEIIKFRSKN